jgi:capsule polysaccharide export protein KpsE/RkpR
MSEKKSKKNNSYNFDLTDIVLFIVKHYKRLFIISLLSAVAAYFATLPIFVKPLYASKSSFYPGTTNSVSSQLFYSIKDRAKDPLAFAELEVVEQYLQLLNSDAIKGRLIEKYDLYNHYGLDPSIQSQAQKMGKLYHDRFTVRRSNFNSIEIWVKDHDPEKAAELANGMMYMVDGMRKEIQGRVAKQVFDVIEKTYNDKLKLVDSIQQRLRELGAEGVFDPASQAKGLSELVGKGQNNQFTEQEKRKLGNMGAEVILLNEMLQSEAENVVFLRTKYDQALIDMNADLSNIFIVDYAGASWDKVYPKRLITMISASIITFFATCIIILMFDQYQRIKPLLKQQ